ncbi:hypothetical protein EV121DRAFT_268752 [Schizophyllum commune]
MPPETTTRSHSLRQSFGRFFPKDSDKEKLSKIKTKEKDLSKDWSDVRDVSKEIPKDFGAKEFGGVDSLTAKQAKQARRSTLGARPSGGRPSLGDLAQDKTVTRRRVSSGQSRNMSLDEGSPMKPHAAAAPPPTTASSSTSTDPPLKRATSLRPRPAASALPKYRPRSGLFDPSRVPKISLEPKGSPRKPKVSREPPSTDDEKIQETSTSSSCADGKPLEVNLTGAIHVSGSPKGKSKAPAPAAAAVPAKPTPTRKLHKAASPAPKPSPVRQGSASPAPKPSAPSPAPKAPATRPGSAASTNSARGPVTPAAAAKAAATTRNESPLARKARASPAPAPAPAPPPPPKAKQDSGNMSDISETSEDESEDEDDVAALLAPVASPGAPTPAMPRVYRTRKTSKASPSPRPSPQTPSRTRRVSTGLTKRRSFLAPSTPAHRKRSAGSLRTPSKSGGKSAPRGSILTWEELAQDSRTLDEDDIAMLADIQAPFRASIASPPGSPSLSPVTLDTPLPPESPALSTMGLTPGTPGGGYGSISQVLLPDVTPSPAPFAASAARYDEAARSPPGDGALTTLLRLQLASSENTARERLMRLQELEEELHSVKAARRAEATELGAQLEALEAELRRAMESRERGEEERHQYVMALEAQAARAKEEAGARAAEAAKRAKAEQGTAVERARAAWQVGCVAEVACARWGAVREMAEGDLGDVKNDLHVLATLLGQLDGERARLQSVLRQ